MPFGCLAVAFLFAVLVLFPLFLADVMITALNKLGLSPQQSLIVLLGIFFGGLVNIPVKRISRDDHNDFSLCDMFGFEEIFPGLVRQRRQTIIAVNLGGCVIPSLIAGYELIRAISLGWEVLAVTLLSVAINSYICYRLAKPVENVGIAMTPFIPALAAAGCGLICMPEYAPLIAFTSGVLGPLIGADLLHMKDISRISTGIASIGGAGTFDGIVLSGIIATLLT